MKFLTFSFLFFSFFHLSFSQNIPKNFSLGEKNTLKKNTDISPASNSITNMAIKGDTIWLGGDKGLSRSLDGGRTWKNYYNTPAFGTEDISAIAVYKNEVWIATAHSVEINGEVFPEGRGLKYSIDGGETWEIIPQPIDKQNIDTLYYNEKSFIRSLGVTTTVNNITYDIAINDSAVWITSFAGMFRKSIDKGKIWQKVIIPPDNLNSISLTDSLVFDVSPVGGSLGLQNNLNHRVFSVFVEDNDTLWVGTAGGINKSTDGGKSWKKFNHLNQSSSISGNFVRGINKQWSNGKQILWAATKDATSGEQQGVSFSEDGGENWKTTLLGESIYNISFKDSIVYAVGDNGIFRSTNWGISWTSPQSIVDNITNAPYTKPDFYAVANQKDTIWFGGADGTAITIDNAENSFGSSWKILRVSKPLSSLQETYAYPNPFSPDDEVVRFHYALQENSTITIRIFDFGMNLVRTLVKDVLRKGPAERDEIWDGKNDNKQFVSNGVYFYQITGSNEKPIWGKILVVQ